MPAKGSRQQFCKYGHDVFICGRSRRQCNQCLLERNRIDSSKDSRFTQFCPRGHDKNITGKDKCGKCSECRKIKDSLRKKKAHEADPEKYNERSTKWKKENSEKTKLSDRKNNLKRYYGLTWEAYQKILTNQNNKCAICFIEFTGGNYIPCVDHDHKTGKVRGLLCKTCNSALGHLKDDIILFEQAIIYLKVHKI
jgi:hypothetical protein